MKSLITYLSLSFLASVTVQCFAAPVSYDVDGALKRLDNVVANRDKYYNRRVSQIDSIKHSLEGSTPTERLLNLERVGDEFSPFDNDSALVYFNRGLRDALTAHNDSMVNIFKLKLASHLPVAGIATLASEYFQSIDTVGMSRDMKFLYLESGFKMSYFMALLHQSQPDIHDMWTDSVKHYQLNMVKFQEPVSDMYLKNLGDYYFNVSEQGKAWNLLVELLGRLEQNSTVYANTAEILARIAAQRGDTETQKYYLALAASSDIYAATREVSALQELAALLFKDDDVARSYEYMSVALENAIDCHAVARMMEISPQLPLITAAHGKLMDWWTAAYAVIITILGICIVIIFVIAFYLARHIKGMKVMQCKLMEANKAKEVYISQFMVLCSVYMDKLNQFNNLVNRKLGAGQSEDLYKLTKSGKLIEEQARDFYAIFDNAFLHIYPTFVEDVNSLLLPEERIELKEGELLNTDLRILACLRIGLDDANRIAQILNYSVNTIYAYRNRIRNRAINRLTFEADLMKLGYK